MPGLIRKQFASLYRSLRLQPASIELSLADVASPVVLLHEHCEGEPIKTVTSFPGIIGAGTVLAIINLGAPESRLPAGAYAVRIAFSWIIPAGGMRRLNLFKTTDVGVIATPQFFGTCYYSGTGLASEGRYVWEWPKLHLEEGEGFALQLVVAHVAADFLGLEMTMQPL